MHDNVRFSSVVSSEQCFHLRSFFMSFMQRYVSIHKNVQFDGVVVANASGA